MKVLNRVENVLDKNFKCFFVVNYYFVQCQWNLFCNDSKGALIIICLDIFDQIYVIIFLRGKVNQLSKVVANMLRLFVNLNFLQNKTSSFFRQNFLDSFFSSVIKNYISVVVFLADRILGLIFRFFLALAAQKKRHEFIILKKRFILSFI